ncbi:MAG TPA: glycosyltransferase family 2 protein [Mycobacteriales bacterium]|nr:glycosyltransferase family 2 protein [Mycobacteriales bacterium]
MAVDVSVVIPAYNPGANLDAGLRSALDQTLAADRYEVVVVDDGSTDGTAEWLDRQAAASGGRLVVHRIPPSGWPGRPRNVGVDLASGRYIQFLDADDALHPQALARLLAAADSSDADVVVGKLASDFRGLNHHVFRRSVTGRTIRDYPLVDTLTPHKMFRRQFLLDHAIRFAEGPRHVEDEHFCMQAYVHARSVAVVADVTCYFYRRRRTGGRNLGDTPIVPEEYFRDLGAVLDVLDAGVPDADERLPLQLRFYRTEVLGRLRGGQMLRYADDHRRALLEAARAAATARFDPRVRDSLPALLRIQANLLLAGDVDGLVRYAERLEALRLSATATAVAWGDGRLHVSISGGLTLDGEPLQLTRDGDDWLVPASLAADAPAADRRIDAADLADIDCALVSRADAQLWSNVEGLSLAVADDGRVVATGEVALDPWSAQAGAPLPAGLWDVRLRVSFSGLTRVARLVPAADGPAEPEAWVTAQPDGPRAAIAYWTSPQPALALDVDGWMHALQALVAGRPEAAGGRRLRLAAPAIHGPDGGRHPAQFLLALPDRTVCCPGTLRTAPGGSAVDVQLPRGVSPAEAEAGWLRIGDSGAAEPVPRADAATADS